MKIAIISHPDCLLHDMGYGHPEQPARLRVIEEAIKKSGLMTNLEHYLAQLVLRDQLMRVHQADYIDTIFQLSPRGRINQFNPDTSMNPHSLTAAWNGCHCFGSGFSDDK